MAYQVYQYLKQPYAISKYKKRGRPEEKPKDVRPLVQPEPAITPSVPRSALADMTELSITTRQTGSRPPRQEQQEQSREEDLASAPHTAEQEAYPERKRHKSNKDKKSTAQTANDIPDIDLDYGATPHANTSTDTNASIPNNTGSGNPNGDNDPDDSDPDDSDPEKRATSGLSSSRSPSRSPQSPHAPEDDTLTLEEQIILESEGDELNIQDRFWKMSVIRELLQNFQDKQEFSESLSRYTFRANAYLSTPQYDWMTDMRNAMADEPVKAPPVTEQDIEDFLEDERRLDGCLNGRDIDIDAARARLGIKTAEIPRLEGFPLSVVLKFWQVPGIYAMLQFGDTLDAAILGDVMGLGKTIQMIGYIHAVCLDQVDPKVLLLIGDSESEKHNYDGHKGMMLAPRSHMLSLSPQTSSTKQSIGLTSIQTGSDLTNTMAIPEATKNSAIRALAAFSLPTMPFSTVQLMKWSAAYWFRLIQPWQYAMVPTKSRIGA
jgi:hypothetical protein